MADNNVSNPTLKPRRGSYNSMHNSDTVLEDGEIFFEIGNNGIPTIGPDAISFGKIKMGDGFTAYKDLGYFVDVDTTAVDWDNSGYASATSESQGADLYCNLNDIKPSATIKSIFGNIKALLYKLATKVTTLNNVTEDISNKLYNLDTKVTILNDVTEEQIDDINNKVPFSFGVDSDGNYGYKKAGADTVTPFKTVGTRSSSIIANGTYTAISDINKDGYSSVTVAVPNNVQTKTVTAGTSNIDVTPDSGYVGMSKVTVAPTPTETKTATPSPSAQTVTPSSGKYLSSVTVNAINTQTKTVRAGTSQVIATPDSGKYLTAVAVDPTPSYEKEINIEPGSGSTIINHDDGKYLSKVYIMCPPHTETRELEYRVQAQDDDIDDTIDLGQVHRIRYIHIYIDAPR